jgi:cytochrome c oxidase subunit 2
MKRIRFLSLLVFIWILILTAGCTAGHDEMSMPPSTMEPASPSGIVMSDLMIQSFVIAGVVFVVVESLLLIAVFRHRHRGGGPLQTGDLPNQTEGNNILESAWTIAPAIVLAIVFYISVIAYQAVEEVPFLASPGQTQVEPINIRVVGYQFWWQFEYPELGINTANEYHVPVDTIVMLSVESGDVIHSYWVPRLGRKVDGIPGHVNYTWFKALEPGEYVGECAELCGEQHAHMRFKVFVDSKEDFQKWVAAQQSPAPEMTGAAAAGEEIFMQGSCLGCHTIKGTEANGLIGPDLTHIGSREMIAGGMMENTPENMAEWLLDPQRIKPGNNMPTLGLSDDQVNSLVEFLKNLK